MCVGDVRVCRLWGLSPVVVCLVWGVSCRLTAARSSSQLGCIASRYVYVLPGLTGFNIIGFATNGSDKTALMGM